MTNFKEENQPTIQHIALVPDCAFNLISFLKRLKQGWLLLGDAHALELISPDGKN